MNLDNMLVFHCAPTLVGLKPANLVAHELMENHYSICEIDFTKETLRKKGVHMERIWACTQRELTLVYNKSVLENHLNAPEIWGYLMVQGYPMYSGLDAILEHLKSRMTLAGGFPHEVGLFLGYPLIDVLGFIRNKGQNCKYCGYWKVYGDADEAKCLFDSYSKVRDEMVYHINNGLSIGQILQVA